MALVRKHFPEAVFTTYSAEEPCFTSCLPGVLRSFGYLYASTKNPDTMWGGYTRAYGGELVNWTGPDGSRLLTVPRYACEDLRPNSTWQSMAWNNSTEYIEKCFASGIKNPVGMCIQDANWNSGWAKGPWLTPSRSYQPTVYKTWRNYIKNCSVGVTADDWHFTQEDVLVSLAWGTEVLRRLAQEVRVAENRIIVAEKLAALAKVYRNRAWAAESIDVAWQNLMLAQHHDCWIVPFGGRTTRTWAERVTVWTNIANSNSDDVIEQSTRTVTRAGDRAVTVYNTLAFPRDGLVEVQIPTTWKRRTLSVVAQDGAPVPSQMTERDGNLYLAFIAKAVPPVGYAGYKIEETAAATKDAPSVKRQKDGSYLMESDLYAIVIDPAKGGTIKSIRAKGMKGQEFVDTANERGFNELRGYFVSEKAFLSSTQSPATVEILEQGALSAKVAIHGKIGKHPFTQTVRVVQGEKRIDMSVKIDWEDSPLIGEGFPSLREDPRRPCYDERYKLLVHFPANMKSQQIYKDAPFDVCESRLEDTFFNRWDEIKHNVIVHWVDLYDKTANNGLALFADHTTSYAHGKDHPLALTVQYSGGGLYSWGRDYTVTRPTEISYAIIPHAGTWIDSRIWSESERINEPLLGMLTNGNNTEAKSLLSVQDNAYELSSLVCKGDDLYVRFFNASNAASTRQVTFNFSADRVELVELNGDIKETLKTAQTDGKTTIELSMPPFGIRTVKLIIDN
jgi:alpha-mannosidase